MDVDTLVVTSNAVDGTDLDKLTFDLTIEEFETEEDTGGTITTCS